MTPVFTKIAYTDLNARQKEVYNFQWISGALATYGYHTHQIPDDWEGADFIARHMVTSEEIRVQLKGRIHFAKKYLGKNIWIAFRAANVAYLFPHDAVLEQYQKLNPMRINKAWQRENGAVHWRKPTKDQLRFLEPYKIGWSLD
ncbi:MAG TPA: hypothetical protein VMF67_18365 [Rhizomicrobium sp.]|nr:hypothetical protein [Rhizomicrobium sp.]